MYELGFLISGLIFGISAGFYGITFFNKNLINKCLKELKANLDEQEIIKDPAKEKTKEYLHVLKMTKERFHNYFSFYSLYEYKLLNELIEKLEDDLK